MKLSIVICTHNRARWLKVALDSLYKQSVDVKQFPVIVVDNNSSDDTREIVEGFLYHGNLQYCIEHDIGISHARNRGWREAQTDYVGYLDDDAQAPQEWLEVALRIIDERAPAVFGGPYFSYYDFPKPYWFKDSYASAILSKSPAVLQENEYLSGSNMFLKRSLLQEFGGFDTSFGMEGKHLRYGEETEFIKRLRVSNPETEVYYHPDLYVHHLVKQSKLKWPLIMASRFNIGRDVYRIQKSHFVTSYTSNRQISKRKLQVIFHAMRILLIELPKEFLYKIWRRDRTVYQYYQNYVYEQVMKHIRQLGDLYAEFELLGEQERRLRRENV